MDKITEELITGLIGRIEKLEEKVSRLSIPDKRGVHPATKPGMATEGQLNFIKGLGGDPWPDMTTREASNYIDKLKSKKPKKEKPIPNTGGPMGQALMDPNIIDSSRDYGESKPLTKEEIEELGEEAFL